MNHLTLDLIKEGHKYSSQYKNGLSNHLPMALMSLDCLGAEPDTIKSFYSTYSKILELSVDNGVVIEDVDKYFGLSDSYTSLVSFFESELSKKEYSLVINDYLGVLEAGISGAAFHPFIRLAFAIQIDDRTEIAHALASWVVAYQELDGKEQSTQDLSLLDSLLALKTKFSGRDYKPEGYGVFRRMKSVSEQSEFSSFYNSFELNDNSIEQMAEILIKLYLSTNDSFTALHAVTSCHALRVISNCVGSVPESLLRYYWEAIGTAYIDIGLPKLDESSVKDNLPSWDEIKKAACLSTNDHVIKLVYTCYEEFHHYKNPLYQLAASKKVKLI